MTSIELKYSNVGLPDANCDKKKKEKLMFCPRDYRGDSYFVIYTVNSSEHELFSIDSENNLV